MDLRGLQYNAKEIILLAKARACNNGNRLKLICFHPSMYAAILMRRLMFFACDLPSDVILQVFKVLDIHRRGCRRFHGARSGPMGAHNRCW